MLQPRKLLVSARAIKNFRKEALKSRSMLLENIKSLSGKTWLRKLNQRPASESSGDLQSNEVGRV